MIGETIGQNLAANPVFVATNATNATTELGEKQGSILCNSCCDLRRATIGLAILSIVKVGSEFLWNSLARMDLDDDDEYQATLAGTGILLFGRAGFLLPFQLASVCSYLFQVAAAIKYNVVMLASAVVLDCIILVFDLWLTFSIAIADMDHYPIDPIFLRVPICVTVWAISVHTAVGLLLEIKKGIMSRETYPREAHSCCCLSVEPMVSAREYYSYSN